MRSVFISYSRVDADVANSITTVLSDLGVEYFRDIKNIDWGDAINSRVRDELKKCVAVLVIISPASLKSQWVPYEIGHASALDKRILPFLTHPSIEPPMYIRDLNFITSMEQVKDYFSSLEFTSEISATDESEELTTNIVPGLKKMADDLSREIERLNTRLQQLGSKEKPERQQLSESILAKKKEKEALLSKAEKAKKGILHSAHKHRFFVRGVMFEVENLRLYPVQIEVNVKSPFDDKEEHHTTSLRPAK